jgi:hypothetical protein
VNSTPDGGEPGAEFILPRRDVVHPENWEEWKERGFEWRRNAPLKPGETTFTAASDFSLRALERLPLIGTENIVTGDPFDSKAGRPVQRPGELGIYWRPPENQ